MMTQLILQLILILKRIMSRSGLFLLSIVLMTALVTAELGSQYVPVSKRYPGIQIGSDSAPVTVELVYDPTCGGSAELDQNIRQVITKLGDNANKFTFKYAISALPYHISSFKLAQAVNFVNSKNGSALALTTLRQFLDNIENWDEKAIQKISINDHITNIANKISEITKISVDAVRPEILHYSATDGETRKWTKYVMGTLHIPGTPFMFVNGARLDGAGDKTVDELVDYLQKLL